MFEPSLSSRVTLEELHPVRNMAEMTKRLRGFSIFILFLSAYANNNLNSG
jgi:hypothetical protein